MVSDYIKKFDKGRRSIITVVVLLFLLILLSLPSILVKNPYVSPDIHFHINRILGISDGLSHGDFPVRLSAYWLNGYGYPASIYYGDILLYLPALLHLAGVDILVCYNIYIIFINVLTVVIAYICFKKIFVSRKVAVLLAAVYCTSNYRLSDIYFRGAIGEATAIAFLPLVILALYKIYTSNEKWIRTAVVFAVGMTGIITSHIITAVLVVIGIIFICLFFPKETFKPTALKTYLLAVFITLLLSAYFIIPFLDYYLNVDTLISNTVSSGNTGLYYNSAAVIEIFNFFGGADKISYSPGIFMTMALLMGILLVAYKKINKKMLRISVIAVIILILSSNIFPWDFLVEHVAIFRFVSAIQFPFRFIIISIMLLIFLSGVLLRELASVKKIDKWNSDTIIAAIFCLVALFMGAYVVNYCSKNHVNERMSIDSLDIGAGSEYLLSGARQNDFNNTDVKCDGRVELISQKGNERDYLVEGCSNGSVVTFPVLNYRYINLYDERGSRIETFDSDGRLVSFKVVNDYEGKVSLRFEVPVVWRISELISLIAILSLGIVGIKMKLL